MLRRLLRFIPWLMAFTITGSLAWWGWHLPPAPRCELEGSAKNHIIGFSVDSRWFAATENHDGSCARTLIWNAQTGQRVQSLNADFNIGKPHYWTPLVDYKHWQLIIEQALPANQMRPKVHILNENGDLKALSPEITNADHFVSKNNQLLLWDHHNNTQTRFADLNKTPIEYRALPAELQPAALSADGNVVICSHRNQWAVVLWNCVSNTELATFENTRHFGISRNRKHIAVRVGDEFHIRDLASGFCAQVPMPTGTRSSEYAGDVWSFLIASNGRRLLIPSARSQRHFFVIDVPSGQVKNLHLPTALEHLGAEEATWLDHDGDRFFYRDVSGDFACWNLAVEQPRLEAVLTPAVIQLPDPAKTTPLDRGWSIGSTTPKIGFAGGLSYTTFGGPPQHYCFSADSQWASYFGGSSSTPSTFVTWFGRFFPLVAQGNFGWLSRATLVDLKNWNVLGRWYDCDEPIFSPDGKTIAIAALDGPITLWDLPPKRRWKTVLLMQMPVVVVIAMVLQRIKPHGVQPVGFDHSNNACT